MTETMSISEYKKASKKKGNKPSKYKSVKTTVGDTVFDSKKESEYYRKLVALKNAGVITDIELQVRYPYHVIYTRRDQDSPTLVKNGSYIADFRVEYADGHVEVVDTKGYMTDVAKRKIEIVKALYNIDVKIV